MIPPKNVRSPKRDRSSIKRSSDLFHYYAGFSPGFVRDVLTSLNIDPYSAIMDPWNGSGATTQVARDMGISAIGLDLNPVMVIVAKAKLLNCSIEVRDKILADLDSIIKASSNLKKENSSNEEPLEDWLEPESAMCFRNLDRAVHLLLVNEDYCPIYAQGSLENLSCLASFFYLALFKTLRSFLAIYVSSNPTWIKISSAKKDNLHPSPNEIYKELKTQIHTMINAIVQSRIHVDHRNSAIIKIQRASSDSIPLSNSSIDLVISSPPYCTRIDYAIATSPELALLGCSMNGDLKNLRDSMIGTPTITKRIPEIKSEWGQTCGSFLNAVEGHNSKASKSYYHKYHIQYFDAIYRSFLEIDRTLVTSGKCVIVVQDSYNKNIHNDLPKIFCEMTDSMGWATINRLDFDIKRTMASRNHKAKKYRSDSNATESVLIFEKEGTS